MGLGRWLGCLLQRDANSLKHSLYFSQHVIIPKPDYSESSRLQPLSALTVIVGLFLMLSTVKLNDQSLLVTEKINDVPAYGFLTTELVAEHLMTAKVAP